MYRFARHIERWAVGVATAPRSPMTAARSISSLWNADFGHCSTFVSCDAGTPDLGLPSCHELRHDVRKGAFFNWLWLLRFLLEERPTAQAILIAQDDVLYCRGLRSFLEHDLWPKPHCGVVSLFLPKCPGFAAGADGRGCREVAGIHRLHALALVFPRFVAEQIANHPLIGDWQSGRVTAGYQDYERFAAGGFDFERDDVAEAMREAKANRDIVRMGMIERANLWYKFWRYRPPAERKFIDAFVGQAIRKMHRKPFFYDPSLTEHMAPTADEGAIGHGGSSGGRVAMNFAGENVDAGDVFADHRPRRRWNFDESGGARERWPKN